MDEQPEPADQANGTKAGGSGTSGGGKTVALPDRPKGQFPFCYCLPGFMGSNCSLCKDNHWGLKCQKVFPQAALSE